MELGRRKRFTLSFVGVLFAAEVFPCIHLKRVRSWFGGVELFVRAILATGFKSVANIALSLREINLLEQYFT